MKKWLTRFLLILTIFRLGGFGQLYANSVESQLTGSEYTHPLSLQQLHFSKVYHGQYLTPFSHSGAGECDKLYAEESEGESEDELSSHKKNSLSNDIIVASFLSDLIGQYFDSVQKLRSVFRYRAYTPTCRYILFRVFRI